MSERENATDRPATDRRWTIGLTAGSEYDLGIEREVLGDLDVEFRPADVASEADLIEHFRGVDAVIDRLIGAHYTAEVIDGLERCKVIVRCGMGVDSIDVERAAERGIYVANVPSYCEREVAEHTIGLLLALQRDLVGFDADLKAGCWDRTPSQPMHHLHGRTLGLVGFGTIARLVAERARTFGMDVIAADPYVDAEEMAERGVDEREREGVLAEADVVSLHAPLTDDTAGMIDAEALERMRSSAYLLNVARGGLVVENDLLAALEASEIAGAGLDVFVDEPSAQGSDAAAFENPLRERDDAILTPHVAWKSVEANEERRREGAREVRRVLEGDEPENAVNEPA